MWHISMGFNEDIKDFIGDLTFECAKNGVRLLYIYKYLPDMPIVERLQINNGFFDPITKTLAVKFDKDPEKWISTALHEYCHMLQWIENPKKLIKIAQSYDKYHRWVDGNYKLTNINKHIKKIIDLEFDCNSRVVKLVKKKKYDFNLKVWAQQINALEYQYKVIMEHHKLKQHQGVPVYRLYDMFPKKLDKNFVLPKHLEKKYIAELMGK